MSVTFLGVTRLPGISVPWPWLRRQGPPCITVSQLEPGRDRDVLVQRAAGRPSSRSGACRCPLPMHANGMATPAHPGVAYLVPRGGDLHLVKLVAEADGRS